jgi:hypothetical protein
MRKIEREGGALNYGKQEAGSSPRACDGSKREFREQSRTSSVLRGGCRMTLQDIIVDIHALRDDLAMYERKYGVLSETFYEAYRTGEEPEDESWVLDWAGWAGAYQTFLRRQEQYRRTIQALRGETEPLVEVIERTARREPIPVPS